MVKVYCKVGSETWATRKGVGLRMKQSTKVHCIGMDKIWSACVDIPAKREYMAE